MSSYLPDSYECAGFDRTHLNMQESHTALIEAVAAVNPSGRLTETFPFSLEDTPCYENFAGEGKDVEYHESIFVGYRYYDRAEKTVAYPFGYGLSYTTFSYDPMDLLWDEEAEKGEEVFQQP